MSRARGGSRGGEGGGTRRAGPGQTSISPLSHRRAVHGWVALALNIRRTAYPSSPGAQQRKKKKASVAQRALRTIQEASNATKRHQISMYQVFQKHGRQSRLTQENHTSVGRTGSTSKKRLAGAYQNGRSRGSDQKTIAYHLAPLCLPRLEAKVRVLYPLLTLPSTPLCPFSPPSESGCMLGRKTSTPSRLR